jgi:hypothetical protein
VKIISWMELAQNWPLDYGAKPFSYITSGDFLNMKIIVSD